MWDAIVIGSGIGGLAAAAALGKHGRRVLLLEQHAVPGGLTQTFQRQRWTFATGVHYFGGVGGQPGPEGQFGRLLDWLSDGTLKFAPCDNPYDIVHLPNFEFGIAHPEAAYRDALQARFPGQGRAVHEWFEACDQARRSAFTLFALRGMPPWLAFGLRWLRGAAVDRWARQTLAAQLSTVADRQLRAVLGARWGDYGATPERAPFLEHALVTGSFNAGAYYPVGGPGRFAESLLPALRAGNGELRTSATVRHILVEDQHVVGVTYDADGVEHEERAKVVISAMGAANTVACLGDEVAAGWRQSVSGFAPGLSYLCLYLGFEGDIRAAGATSANAWIYDSADIGRIWQDPADSDAPSLYVSFPSLKDPAAAGAPTAEVVALADAAVFARWMDLPAHERPEDYRALKARAEERLLAQFLRQYPRLQPLLRFHELSTPVTQHHFVRSPDGAMYGIEMSGERMLSPALRVKTPVHGLLLAGQDVASPGIQGAFMGGWMAAASVDPALWMQMGR